MSSSDRHQDRQSLAGEPPHRLRPVRTASSILGYRRDRIPTVNVFNDDRQALHKLVFDAANGDTVQRMPFFNNGQVVASEKLAKGTIVEVRCMQHPWTRAYIATFDHPYFAVTEKDGVRRRTHRRRGKYTVNVWHEGMKQARTQQVQVDANGSATLDLALKLSKPRAE